MSLILLVFGILITGAGVVVIAFGSTVSDSALGQSLIITGAITVVGGPLLMGAASLITQLSAIAESLRLRPTTQIPRLADARQPSDSQRRPPEASDPRLSDPRLADPRLPDPRPSEPRQGEPRQGEPRQPEARPPEPTPAPTAAIEVSGSALERLRSTMRPDRVVANGEDVPLSPNGSGHHGTERKSEPRPEPEARPGGPAETGKEPRLDFLFRPKTPPRPSQNPEQFDSMWPKRRPGDQSKPDEVARQPSSGGEPPRVEREPRSVAILKSGVVDGMAYPLYADGSIEAQLPHGTVRFGSIAELRAHIENNS